MNENKNASSEENAEKFSWMDDLDRRETESLLAGIDEVSLSSDERMRLRAKVLARTEAEERGAIPEEESDHAIKKSTVRIKSRKRMRRAILCIAALMVCSLVAVGASNMDGLQRFWGNNTEIYGEKTVETIQSVQNENVKFNIEGIVADKYQCVLVVSMEALTEEGRKIMKKACNLKQVTPAVEINYALKEGFSYPGTRGIFQYTDDNRNKDYKAFKCDFELACVDLAQPATIEFDGLIMQFFVPEQLPVITLRPESEGGSEYVELSSIGYYYRADDFAEIRLINQDGTLDEKLGYHGGLSQEEHEETMVIGSFTELVDLDCYNGVRIDGINYTLSENEEIPIS